MVTKKERLLKLNKKFEPPVPEDGDEFFANGIFEFNVTKLIVFIETKPESFPVEQIEVQSVIDYKSEHLDKETIRKANLSNPILLGEISPGRFNVIDGNHRLERARQNRAEKVPARRVFADQHIAFLTSMRAYEAYVKYWNEKIKEQS
jgi:hypothetical protein